jgi:drug/metabolite transporter (DMT)-like permease
MSIGVFLAVLFAALLHASWNAIIKFGEDKMQGMIILSIAHGLIGLCVTLVFPAPAPEAWGWLGASVLFHLVYKFCLTTAYRFGDLGRVYPLARGTAPAIVLAVGFFILPDEITALQIAAVVLLAFGIVQMARGVFAMGESRRLLPFALGSALGTAGYSISDGMGARASGDASGYVGWLFMGDAVLFTLWGLRRRGLGTLPRSGRIWALGLAAGAGSVGAYWIAVWAMTVAPIALVTALRETSVMFAVLIGMAVLGERADARKLIAAVFIVAGVILIRI